MPTIVAEVSVLLSKGGIKGKSNTYSNGRMIVAIVVAKKIAFLSSYFLNSKNTTNGQEKNNNNPNKLGV